MTYIKVNKEVWIRLAVTCDKATAELKKLKAENERLRLKLNAK